MLLLYHHTVPGCGHNYYYLIITIAISNVVVVSSHGTRGAGPALLPRCPTPAGAVWGNVRRHVRTATHLWRAARRRNDAAARAIAENGKRALQPECTRVLRCAAWRRPSLFLVNFSHFFSLFGHLFSSLLLVAFPHCFSSLFLVAISPSFPSLFLTFSHHFFSLFIHFSHFFPSLFLPLSRRFFSLFPVIFLTFSRQFSRFFPSFFSLFPVIFLAFPPHFSHFFSSAKTSTWPPSSMLWLPAGLYLACVCVCVCVCVCDRVCVRARPRSRMGAGKPARTPGRPGGKRAPAHCTRTGWPAARARRLGRPELPSCAAPPAQFWGLPRARAWLPSRASLL